METPNKPSETVVERQDRRRRYSGPTHRVYIPILTSTLEQVDARVTVTNRRTDVLNDLIRRGLQSPVTM